MTERARFPALSFGGFGEEHPAEEGSLLDAPTVDVATTTTRSVPREQWVPLALAAVPALLALVVLIASLGNDMSFWGDAALLEVGVMDALDGRATLGVYSNWGYAHPGPAMFYLIAPFYWLVGRNPVGLPIGALAINAASMVGIVLVVRRFVSTTAGAVAALVLTGYAVAWQPVGLWSHSNPAVVPLPLLFTTVLVAAAWAGSVPALAGAALVGTVVAQTHLGAVPVVAVLLLVGAIGLVRTRPHRHLDRRAWLLPAALLVVTGTAWVPPLAEQATRDPGNIGTIALAFRSPPDDAPATGYSLTTAIRGVASESLTFPLGWPSPYAGKIRNLNGSPLSDDWRAQPVVRIAVWVAALAASAAAARIAARRGRPALSALAVLPLVTSAVLVVSATRIVGIMFNYLLWGAATSLVPTWIVLLTLLAERWPRPGLAMVYAGTAALCVGFALEVAKAGQLEPHRFALTGREIAASVEAELPDGGPVAVRWTAEIPQAIGSAVVADLNRMGIDARPHPAFWWNDSPLSGGHRSVRPPTYLPGHRPTGDEQCELHIGARGTVTADGTPYSLTCRS